MGFSRNRRQASNWFDQPPCVRRDELGGGNVIRASSTRTPRDLRRRSITRSRSLALHAPPADAHLTCSLEASFPLRVEGGEIRHRRARWFRGGTTLRRRARPLDYESLRECRWTRVRVRVRVRASHRQRRRLGRHALHGERPQPHAPAAAGNWERRRLAGIFAVRHGGEPPGRREGRRGRSTHRAGLHPLERRCADELALSNDERLKERREEPGLFPEAGSSRTNRRSAASARQRVIFL